MSSPNDGNLFLPLDLNFWDDPDILAVGFLGGVLYQHMLMLSKRTKSDGTVSDLQIRKFAIPGSPRLLSALEGRGLIVRTTEGWTCPAYLKRNKSAAEINETRRLESEAAALGNHRKWHIGEKGKPSPRCDYCTGRIVDPKAPPDDDPTRVPDRGGESTETKPEPESRTKPKTQTGSNSGEPPAAPHEVVDKRDIIFEAVVEACGWQLESISPDERGKANKATAHLKGMKATAADFRARAANYRLHYPDLVITPQAVMGNWSLCQNPPSPSSNRRPGEVTGPRIADPKQKLETALAAMRHEEEPDLEEIAALQSRLDAMA